MKTKHIFISDVHGCFTELERLLELIHQQNYQKMRIISLGDLINKGPDSTKVISLARKENISVVLGNHELGYFRRLKRKEPLAQKFREKIGEENHAFLKKQSLFIEHKDFIAVHAGIDARPLNNISDSAIYAQKISTLLKESDSSTLTTIRNIDINTPWHAHYKGKKPIIYGHWARQGVLITPNSVCLDSGCVYGQRLSAYVLEEKTIFSVCAQKIYVKAE